MSISKRSTLCKVNNNLYTIDVCKDIYKRLMDMIQLRDQWDWPEVIHTRMKYQHKAETLLELLENIMVFHVGVGYTGKCHHFNERVKSFQFLV